MSERKKLVYLTSRIPFPLEKGDKLRAYHQMRLLGVSHDIHLIVVSNSKLKNDAKVELEKFCKSVRVYETKTSSILTNMFISLLNGLPFQVGYFFNSGAHYFIHQAIKEIQPNHIFVQLIRMSEYVKDIKHIPKTIDYIDSFSMGMKRRKEKEKSIKKAAYAIESSRLKKYAEKIFPFFDNHILISEQDKDTFDFKGAENISVIPNGVDQEYFSPDRTAEKKYDLIFTGNMSYPPNVNAVVFITEKILPLVWEKQPNCNLLIAGAEPNSVVKSLATDKVIVSGWMDDIRDAYNAGKICVTPLNIGTGLQNKLLEAMSMELPCITSTLANNALQAKASEEILIANTAQEFANDILSLLDNEDARKSLGLKGKQFIIDNYHWKSIIQKMEKIMFQG